MIAMPTEIWKLPVPATSLVRGPDFIVLPMRQCEITFYIEGREGHDVPISLIFAGVEAFKCTYLKFCTADMFNSAYARLVRLDDTAWLSELTKTCASDDQSQAKLQHLMICFDDGPCFEMICRSFEQRR